MLELELLVGLLDPAKLLELGLDLFVHRHTFGHDRPLARLFTPTRQHEGVDVKRLGDVAYGHARELAQADGRGLEMIAVAIGRSGTWGRHLETLLIVRSGWSLKRRNYRIGLNELLGGIR